MKEKMTPQIPSALNLKDSIITRDPSSLRHLLDNGENPQVTFQDGDTLYHLLIKSSLKNESNNAQDDTCIRKGFEQRIVYILSDAGVNVDAVNDMLQTPLECAVRDCLVPLCDVLLQCGADMHSRATNGRTILEFVHQQSSETEIEKSSLLQVFQKYYPGLCRAVTTSSIADVRRLTNLWCRTDLQQNGKTLQELAIETGHEEIIDLILGIQSSMKLVHHVLARNTKAACRILESAHNKLQLNIRNMSNNGAPILYYAIQDHDAELVKLFVEKGSRVYTMMRDGESHDLPVLFTAIKPDIPVEILEALLPENKPQQEELLYRLLYKGKTILEVAVERHVPVEVFSALIDRGGPMLLACRNKLNETIEDVVISNEETSYINVIDQKIMVWLTQPESFPNRRKILALWGYVNLSNWKDENGEMASKNINSQHFLTELQSYQDQIAELKSAVESGDVASFEQLRKWAGDPELFECDLAWSARLKGDGLPLLHRAVLHNRPEIVTLLLASKPQRQSVDSLLDQFHRTALHYAYGMPEAEEIRSILLVNGCSEHTLDKNGCEPLDFKIKQGTEEMKMILERMKENSSNMHEPNWWSECKWGSNENGDPSITSQQQSQASQEEEGSDAEEAENLQYTIRCEIL